eukprot:g7969.t1
MGSSARALLPCRSVLTATKLPHEPNKGRPRHFAVSLALTNDKNIIAVALSAPLNNVLLYKIQTFERIVSNTQALNGNNNNIIEGPRNIREIKFSPADKNLLVMVGESGVRCLYFKEDNGVMAWSSMAITSLDTHTLAFGCGGGLLACGHENGVITFWDANNQIGGTLRNQEVDQRSRHQPSTLSPIGEYNSSHTDAVLTLGFHPQDDTKLVSAAADGTCNFYNVSAKSEDEAYLMTWTSPNKSDIVQFFTYTDRQTQQQMVGLVTSTHSLSLWSVESGECKAVVLCSNLEEFSDTGPNHGKERKGTSIVHLGFDYIADVAFDEGRDMFIISAGKYVNRKLYRLASPAAYVNGGWCSNEGDGPVIFDKSMIQVDCELNEGHYGVVRDVLWVDGSACLTCGEDAKLCLWANNDLDGEQHMPNSDGRTVVVHNQAEKRKLGGSLNSTGGTKTRKRMM